MEWNFENECKSIPDLFEEFLKEFLKEQKLE